MTSRLLQSQATRCLPSFRALAPKPRSFSSSVSVFKKKRAVQTNDDLFAAYEFVEDDLFSTSSQPSKTFDSARRSNSEFSASSTLRKPFAEEFSEQYDYVNARIGSKPQVKHPLPRQRALRRLLHVSQGKEDLDKIVGLLESWRASGFVIDKQTAVQIIDRCLAWNPPLILSILSSRSKTGFTIPSLTEARRILHKLVFCRPADVFEASAPGTNRTANAEALRNAATFAALLPASGLKRAHEDLVCCALLAQACARNLLSIPSSTGEKVDPLALGVPEAESSIKSLVTLSKSISYIISHPSSNLKKQLPLPPMSVLAPSLARPPSRSSTLYPLIFQVRESGQTQGGLVERAWAHEAIREVVKALKTVEGVNVDQSIIKTLENALKDGEAGKSKVLDYLAKAATSKAEARAA